MKTIYVTITMFATLLLLSACSGGGGGDGGGSFNTGLEQITITNCNAYTIAQTSDLIVKDSATTTIQIIHDSNGSKSVCVITGSAHIIREVN